MNQFNKYYQKILKNIEFDYLFQSVQEKEYNLDNTLTEFIRKNPNVPQQFVLDLKDKKNILFNFLTNYKEIEEEIGKETRELPEGFINFLSYALPLSYNSYKLRKQTLNQLLEN